MRRLFRVHHRLLDSPGDDRRELVEAGERLWRTIVRSPPEGKARNIAKRFLENGDAYLRFIANPEIEPTNNRAEQAIRQVVIDRAASQGTRSPGGRAYKERMWTVLATCAMRGASAFGFIRQALRAYAENAITPSLLTL
jgi:transposase